MAKGRLKAALDAEKGVDYKQLKEKKQAKVAEKRKRSKEYKKAKAEIVEPGDDDDDASEDEEEEGGVYIDEEAIGSEISKSEEAKLQAELKALLGNKEKLLEIESASESEDDEEDVEELEDDEDAEESSEEEESRIDLSRLADSDSDSSSDDDELEGVVVAAKTNGIAKQELDDEDEEEDEDDIPLSDIESLASEERGDIIPHQRLTINNKVALKKAYDRISLPLSTLPFSVHQSITSQTNTENVIPDVDDDLKRELAFYAQSLSAVKSARAKLEQEGVPFSRPVDYFAEMVKSDEHMGRVKEKLRDEAAGKKASAEARRQRDLKKFGKQVQVAKMQERAKEKRETLDRIGLLKRKRAGAVPAAENEPDMFDVELEDAATTEKKDRDARKRSGPAGGRGKGGDSGNKRRKKDEKYGFGGKKRFAKSGDSQSTSDMRDFPGKQMRKPFNAAKARPGKARRANARN